MSMDRLVRRQSEDWRVVSPPPPGDTLPILTDDFGPDPAAFFQEIFTSGLPGLLAGLINALVNAGREVKAKASRRGPIEGVTEIFDDYWTYLEEYAGLGPTVIKAELPASSADALLRTLEAYLSATPSLRRSPVLVLVGLDEASADVLLTGPRGRRVLDRPYTDRLRLSELSVGPLRHDRIEAWVGHVGERVADVLIVATGGEDLRARDQWRTWVTREVVRRRRRRWEFTPKVAREGARLYEGAIASVDADSAHIARLLLRAAALFGEVVDEEVVRRAVARHSGSDDPTVQAVWSQLLQRVPPVFAGDNRERRWALEYLREQGLGDLRRGREAQALANAIVDTILSEPETARRHRGVALDVLRLYPSHDRLRELGQQTSVNLDEKVHWSMLLTISRLMPPSLGLATELAAAAFTASQRGYLLFAFELASRATDAADMLAVPAAEKSKILLDCGRAFSRTGHYDRAADALEALYGIVSGEGGYEPVVVGLAEALHELGINLRQSGDALLAVDRLNEALALKGGAHGAVAAANRGVAITLYELGVAQMQVRSRDRRAVDITVPRRAFHQAYEGFIASYRRTSHPRDITDAGQCLILEAETFESENAAESTRLLERAKEHLLEAATAKPSPNAWERVALCYSRLGRVAVEGGKEEEALSALSLACDYYGRAYAEDPSEMRRNELANAERAVNDARVLLDLR